MGLAGDVCREDQPISGRSAPSKAVTNASRCASRQISHHLHCYLNMRKGTSHERSSALSMRTSELFSCGRPGTGQKTDAARMRCLFYYACTARSTCASWEASLRPDYEPLLPVWPGRTTLRDRRPRSDACRPGEERLSGLSFSTPAAPPPASASFLTGDLIRHSPAWSSLLPCGPAADGLRYPMHLGCTSIIGLTVSISESLAFTQRWMIEAFS